MNTDKKDFIYVNDRHMIEYSVLIPYDDSIEELVHILLIKNNLPLYIEKGSFSPNWYNTLFKLNALFQN